MTKKTEFERSVEFSPAYDKRNPDPAKNYGIHSVEMRFVLKGQRGTIQFLVYTGWNLPHAAKELQNRDAGFFPMAADIGYHAYVPQYKGQTSMGPCKYLNGQECYYDGNSLAAQKVLDILITEGSDVVWKYMENYYKGRFGDEHGSQDIV